MPGTIARASPALLAAFRGLPPHALTGLAETARRLTFSRGEYVFHTGGPTGYLFVIEEGSIKVSALDPDGRETLLSVAPPGTVVGEFTGTRQVFDARAGEPTIALALPLDEVHRRVAACGAGRLLLEIAAARTRDLARALQHVTRPDTRRRIAARVFDLSEQHGRDVAGGRRLDVALTQEDIGRLAGTSRETANKVISHLGRRGWLTRQGGRYVVTDRDALAAFALGYPSCGGPSASSQSQT